MSTGIRVVRFVAVAALFPSLAALGEVAPTPSPSASSAPSGERVAVHLDSKDLDQAMLDATRGLVRGDGAGVQAAFDRAEKDCRRMTHAEDKIWKRDMVNQDMAMHAALAHARESAGKGDLETAMESFQWIVRTCRDCHKLAKN